MERFEEGYDFVTRTLGAQAAAQNAHEWVGGIEQAVDTLRVSLERLADNKAVAFKKGDLAEIWHAETYNVRAKIAESRNWAEAPRSTAHASPDVILHTPGGTETYQLKYYKNAERSMKSIADKRYADTNHYLIPDDQLREAEKLAHRESLRNAEIRPDQSRRYEDVEKKLVSTIDDGKGAESLPLSEKDSVELAVEVQEHRLDLEKRGITPKQLVQIEDVMRKSVKAGMSAAAISAALAAAPAMLNAIDYLVKTGELDLTDVREAGASAITGASHGFLTGAAGAAAVSSVEIGFLGEALQVLEPSVIGAASVVIVDALLNSYRVACGTMKRAEMVEAVVRDSAVSAAALASGGLLGSVASALTAQALAQNAFGAAGQLLVPVPLLGYVLGSFVGSAAAGIAFDMGKRAVLSLCVESGFTLFDLVEQDYELPDAVLEEIGLDVFDYELFAPEAFEPDAFEPDRFEFDEFSPDRYEITLLRRGVIGIAAIGYQG